MVMVRVLRFVLVLVIVLASSATFARTVGASRASSVAILFTAPDGVPCVLPCLLGVQPGVTRYIEASRILRAHPLIQAQYAWERAGAGTIEIMGTYLTVSMVSDEQGRLAAISVHLQPDTSGYSESVQDLHHGVALLGDAMLELGPPDLIQVSHTKSGLTRMFYPQHGYVTTSFAPGFSALKYLNVADELSYVGLSALDWFDESWHGAMLTAAVWRGFGAVHRYFGRWQ